jgi:2,4-dienoyl-CoA reductase-like NADH-dependent reductase (Old Yellow Enzyme family)
MLFRPLRVGPVTVGDRLSRSATAERAADESGRPGEAVRDIYLALARGGATWINTGCAFVLPGGRSGPDHSGIHTDDMIAPWALIASAVRREAPAARLFMQLVHGGRQVARRCVAEPVAPSALAVPGSAVKPREMTAREIEECIEAFGQAARRAREAGFDGVQLHGAHGYLISQFLSPHANRRADDWGGAPDRRRRFLIEVLRRVRRAAGPDLAVTIKMNCEDFTPDGLTLAESCETARVLAAEGIDAIEVSGWIIGGDERQSPVRKGAPAPAAEGYYLAQAVEIKRAAGMLPVGVCGGWRSLDRMERALEAEGLDFIAVCRPFLAEPDLVHRLRGGQPRASCITCNSCFAARGPVRCLALDEGRIKPPPPPAKDAPAP